MEAEKQAALMPKGRQPVMLSGIWTPRSEHFATILLFNLLDVTSLRLMPKERQSVMSFGTLKPRSKHHALFWILRPWTVLHFMASRHHEESALDCVVLRLMCVNAFCDMLSETKADR